MAPFAHRNQPLLFLLNDSFSQAMVLRRHGPGGPGANAGPTTTGPSNRTLAQATGGPGAKAGPAQATTTTGGLGVIAGPPPRPRRHRRAKGENQEDDDEGQGFKSQQEDHCAGEGRNYRHAVAETALILAEWTTLPNPWKARMRLKAQRIVFEACGAEVSSTKRMLAARIRGDEVFKFGDVAVAQADNWRSQLRDDSGPFWRMTKEEAEQLGPVRRRRRRA